MRRPAAVNFGEAHLLPKHPMSYFYLSSYLFVYFYPIAMKKSIAVLIAGAFVLFMISSASAQISLPEVTVTVNSSNVPEKVDQAFKSTFANAEAPEWYQANKNFLVKFIANDMKNKALFRKDGTLIYHISYGFEKDLPENVSRLVKGQYGAYSINVAVNVKQDQRDIWLVNLEDDKRIIDVKVEGGILNESSRKEKNSQN